MKVFRIAFGSPDTPTFSPEHFQRAREYARAMARACLDGSVTPGASTTEAWGEEASIHIETAGNAYAVKYFVANTLYARGEDAAFVTVDGARPALWTRVKGDRADDYVAGLQVTFL